MKRLDFSTLVIAALACAVVWLAMGRPAEARDGGGGDADRGMIAVTGSYGSGASALYLFDTKSRHLAVYRLENGKALDFVAARDCAHDFLLETYNDQSPQAVKPGVLRKSWEDFNRRGATTPGDAPALEAPADKGKPGIGEGLKDDKSLKSGLPPTEGGKGSVHPDGGR